MEHETCIGVLGGGQLGRMLSLEARRMGFQVIMWTGGDNSGAARLADHTITEPFNSQQAFQLFTTTAHCATVEFENIPSTLIDKVSTTIPIMPSSKAISICQDREKEKTFLRSKNIPTTAFQIVTSAETLQLALEKIPGDVILKTLRDGYDGKGQLLIKQNNNRPSASELWNTFGNHNAILEKRINLKSELSVICARSQDGQTIAYDPAENEHRNHILDISIVPARISDTLTSQAKQIAEEITTALDYIGVLAVEFFVDQDDNLLVNEIAPRPHNSGHHTIDACETSQFEQQVRAVTGLPLGSTRLIQPAVMLNLLGDIWLDPTTPPDWTPIHTTPGAKLHLYGKNHAKPGRKMGHITFTAPTIQTAIQNAEKIKQTYNIGTT